MAKRSDYPEISGKMEKTISVFEADLKGYRAGRANAAVLDKVTIDYYGVQTPLAQVGTISTPEPRTLLIQPWDASLLKEIEKAILASDIGITPTNDGKVIRLNFPPLTQERRQELAKKLSKRAEEAKVAIRAIRRDAVEDFKKQKKAGTLTEDDLKETERDVQNLTDEFIKEVEKLSAAKEKEIMEV